MTSEMMIWALAVTLIVCGAVLVGAVRTLWREVEPEPLPVAVPPTDADRLREALHQLAFGVDQQGIRLSSDLSMLGARIESAMQRPQVAVFPDRDDFRYLGHRPPPEPLGDPIQDARDRILVLVERTQVETAQRAMSEIVSKGLSLDHTYDLARAPVPPRLWVAVLELMQRWGDDAVVPESGFTSRPGPGPKSDYGALWQGG